VLRGDLDNRRHFLGGAREDNHFGPRLVDAAVVFVEGKILRSMQIAARSDQSLDLANRTGSDHL
jgi:hypothetical protein